MTRFEKPPYVHVGICHTLAAFKSNCIGMRAKDPQAVIKWLESPLFAPRLVASDDFCRITATELAPLFRSGLGEDSDDVANWHHRRDHDRGEMASYLRREFDLDPNGVTVELQRIDLYLSDRTVLDPQAGGLSEVDIARLRKAEFSHMIIAARVDSMGPRGKLCPVADEFRPLSKNIKPHDVDDTGVRPH